jgi:antitoxin component of MazEF toxin-antitoxin module
MPDVSSIDPNAPLARVILTGQRGTITLPSDLRKRLQIEENTPLQIQEEPGGFSVRVMRLVPTSVGAGAVSLDDLLTDVTPDNLHKEADMGPAIGREAW